VSDLEKLEAIFIKLKEAEVIIDPTDGVMRVRHKYGQGDIGFTFNADGSLFDFDAEDSR